MSSESMYRVIFASQGKIYEIYAKAIYQSEMYGFIEVEDFVFGERAQVIVDPSEEKLKNEFSSVARSYIPMHSIMRIDEVEKEGISKISETKAGASGNVTPLPFQGMPPPPKPDN